MSGRVKMQKVNVDTHIEITSIKVNCFSLYIHQVLEERIYHIEYNPEAPESYYKSSGKELQPRPVGEENGIVIYNYNPVSAVNYVSSAAANRR